MQLDSKDNRIQYPEFEAYILSLTAANSDSDFEVSLREFLAPKTTGNRYMGLKQRIFETLCPAFGKRAQHHMPRLTQLC
jgi:hypothetical protein